VAMFTAMAGAREAQHLTFAGRYRRIRRIGTGGMARVFLAEDEVLEREVAVKQLPSAAPEEALRRFRREARLGASLNHPNIVAIFDSVIDEDSVLIVMEYVKGESLADRMRRGRLEDAEALPILEQVGAALDHAHAQGVVHRDIKPSNILIGADGTAKLADLGIATAVDATAITGSGDVIGTLAYIAPERLRGEPGDAAADVYSLAAVAFELLSGRRARPEKTPEQLMLGVNERPAPDLLDADPSASPAAAEVLRDAMSPDPGQRPASAGELVGRLQTALETGVATQPVSARRPVPVGAAEAPAAAAEPSGRPPFEPPEWAPRRGRGFRPLAIAALGLAAGLLIGVLLLSGGDGGGGSEPLANRDEAQEPQSEDGSTPPVANETPAPAEEPPAAPAEEPAAPSEETLSASELNDLGYSLIQQGRPEEAIPYLQRAVDTAPQGTIDPYAYALFNLGNALRLAGRPEEAIPILEERLQIPNQRGVVKRELELAYQEAGIAPEPSGGNKPKKSGDDD
jgi:eukaryotic-like serine/threonine-protein kinase